MDQKMTKKWFNIGGCQKSDKYMSTKVLVQYNIILDRSSYFGSGQNVFVDIVFLFHGSKNKNIMVCTYW